MDRSGSTAVRITASYKCTAVRSDHVINHTLHARPIQVPYMAYAGTPAAILPPCMFSAGFYFYLGLS